MLREVKKLIYRYDQITFLSSEERKSKLTIPAAKNTDTTPEEEDTDHCHIGHSLLQTSVD